MSEYLNELRESARQVVEGAGTPAYEDAIWPLVGELGWLLTAVPESLDGLGLGIQELCALHAELGKGLSQAAFLPATLAIDALCESELEDRAEWLGRFTAGELATAPLVEPDLALNDGKLTGTAAAVQSADKAGHALLWTADGNLVALVALEQPGVELTERETWDITRRLFDLKLADLSLDNQVVLAEGETARKMVTRLRTLRDFGLAADALGGSDALLEMTVEHLRNRNQFGRPLALFQALKHRCADLKTRIAAAEALQNESLSRLADEIGSDEARLASQKCKYLACDVYFRVTEEALQLHGGIGMAVEYPCHLYLKRSMLNDHLGGGADRYTAEIADRFLAGVS